MSEAAVLIPQPVRCAIYTRKSTEEGLDKEFNSLDAQREAAEAFIQSQRQEGWLAVPHKYDDGGFTGAHMERPALGRLMADIENQKIDCVVVYKVDRLSRSLLDFARMMSVFEQHGVSFVSVTQQFNTRTPIGRLTLNILLSFAEFERDIIRERTRDKKAAAKRKGKWTGGYVPLGYDLDPHWGKLVVNEAEAEQVRSIFELFVETRSLAGTLEELRRRGWKTKTWLTEKQTRHAGADFTGGSLRRLLENELYTGAVQYRGHSYRGEHSRIVPPQRWRQVQRLLPAAATQQAHKDHDQRGALLQGLLHCADCERLMAHTATRRAGREYRYYVCRHRGCTGQSVAAGVFELAVVAQFRNLARQHGGAKLPPLLREWNLQAESFAPRELRPALQTIAERVTYQRSSGEVLIQLRGRKDKRDA